MYIYDLDLIKEQLHSQGNITDGQILKAIIASDTKSVTKQNMFDGSQYYKSNNTEIVKRSFEYMNNGKKLTDEWRSNNRLPTGFLKTLVDQKVNYSLSKKVIVDNADNIKSILDVNTFIKKIGKESSKKGVGWLFINYSDEGNLMYKVIPSEEIIPVYDTEFEDELIQVIRYYTMSEVSGSTVKNVYKAEIWDKSTVTYYSEDTNGNFVLDMLMATNPMMHYTFTTFEMGQPVSEEGHSWGRVPFVPLWNNEDHLTDLVPVKTFIDIFDKVISDFGNNLEDLQDSIIKLKNYGGMTDKLDEFIEYLKMYKVLPIDSQGDAEYMTLDIPVEARKAMLSILRELIFEFGQGLDVNKVGDGNITNVVIRSRYAGLDLKANEFESNIELFLKDVFWFINEYLKSTGKQQDNLSLVEFTFNRSIIVNNNELVDMCVKSKGIISDRTIMKNHPWVDDVDEEIAIMEEEKQKNIELYGLGNETDNSNNEDESSKSDDNEDLKEGDNNNGDSNI